MNEAGVNCYTFLAPRLTVLESPATGINGAALTTESEEDEPPTATTPTETEPAHATDQPGEETDDEGEGETETGPSPELQQLKPMLEANDLTVTVEESDTLAVVRLGQTDYIRSDGSVEGDGALRAQLETLVADAT